MADQKETVILEFDVDESEAIESINSLTKANKELRAERNALNLQSEQGKRRAQEINALLDQNTNKIKTNVSALEKQKINIGNYKSALDGVHPVLGKVGEGLEAGASGFKSMTLQALRFIATPIGAILAALVTVFTLLKSALSQNDDLMDKFENITNAVSVALEVVVSRVGKLGEALIALASGNFNEAIDLTSQAFSGLADEIANAVKQQQLYLDGARKLEDDTRALNIEIAKNENEIKRLVVASRDRNKSLDEQEDLLRKTLALERETVAAKEDLARRDLVITAKRLRADKEFQQQDNENFDQYIDRLLNSGKLAGEEKDKIAEKVIALESARGSSLAFQEKIANSLSAIEDKRAEALRKTNEELAKNAELERAARIAKLERELKGESTNPFPTQAKIETDITQLMRDQLDQRQKDLDAFYADKNKKAVQSAMLEAQVERQKTQIISGLLGGLSGLMREDSEEQKLITSAQALINTYAAANAAFKSGAEINFAFGVAAAAAATLAGLANVARINDIQFANGGWTGPGSRLQPAGVVHADEYVTPKWQVHSPAAQPHLQALEHQRLRGYADGGLVTSSLSQPIDQQLALANIVKELGPFEVSAVEITKVQKRVTVKEKISKR